MIELTKLFIVHVHGSIDIEAESEEEAEETFQAMSGEDIDKKIEWSEDYDIYEVPDPCGNRDCSECEIGGCDHGESVA